jgi:hypothetical protein
MKKALEVELRLGVQSVNTEGDPKLVGKMLIFGLDFNAEIIGRRERLTSFFEDVMSRKIIHVKGTINWWLA